jgi:hypothetical protein
LARTSCYAGTSRSGLDPDGIVERGQIADGDVLPGGEVVRDRVLEHGANPASQLSRVHRTQEHPPIGLGPEVPDGVRHQCGRQPDR